MNSVEEVTVYEAVKERESEQEYRSWGEYMSSSTNSLDQFAKTYQAKKPSKRKSKTPSSQRENNSEGPSRKAQVEPSVSTQLAPRKEKSSSGRKATSDTMVNQPAHIEVQVQPTTSRSSYIIAIMTLISFFTLT